MSIVIEPRKSIRLIAFDARQVQHLRTVNVVASTPLDPHHSLKEFLQLSSSNAKVGVHPTWMVSPSVNKNIPTIFVNGYSAPS